MACAWDAMECGVLHAPNVRAELIHRLTNKLKAKLLTGPSLPRTFLDPLADGWKKGLGQQIKGGGT